MVRICDWIPQPLQPWLIHCASRRELVGLATHFTSRDYLALLIRRNKHICLP